MPTRHFARLLLCTLLVSGCLAAGPSEDWNTLKLDSSTFTQPAPIVGEHDEFPAFTEDLVRVQWRPADPIYLYVMVPKLVRNPPVVLYLYNYDTETYRFLNEKFAALLTERGVAAVGFSSALSGHRFHDRSMRQWFVSELPESLVATTHDVQMIINYLSTRHDVDVSRIGMFGEGSGAAIAALTASVERRIKAVDLLNTWGDWPAWIAKTSVIPDEERSMLNATAFLDKVAALDPLRFLPLLKIPVRLQYINSDGAIPSQVRKHMESSVPPQAVVIPTEKAFAEYKATSGQLFLNWIKDQLLALPEGSRSEPAAASERSQSPSRN